MSEATRDKAPVLVPLPGWGFSAEIFAPRLREEAGPRRSLRRTDIRSLAGPGFLAQPWRDPPVLQPGAVCDLLGWSLGGQLAMQIAVQHPSRVRRLVLVATTPCFLRRRGWNAAMPRAVFDDFLWRCAQDPRDSLQYFAGLVAHGDTHERSVLRELRRSLSADEPDVVALRAGLDRLRANDLRDFARKIRVPTVVIHGASDRLVPVGAGRWLAAQIPGARFVAFPGAAHAPFLSDRAAFAAALDDFLAAA